MKHHLLFTLMLWCIAVCLQAQSNDGKLGFFIDMGTSYGIKTTGASNGNIKLKQPPSPQIGIGFRRTNRKLKNSYQVQLGYTSSALRLKNEGQQIVLESLNTDATGNGIMHHLNAKLAFQHSLLYLDYKKKWNIRCLVGLGLQYVFTFDELSIDFGNSSPQGDYYGLFLQRDREIQRFSGGNTTTNVVTRFPSVQGSLALQFRKPKKPYSFELYWAPGLTPAITNSYMLTKNYAILADGNAKQMFSNFGVRLLYEAWVKSYE